MRSRAIARCEAAGLDELYLVPASADPADLCRFSLVALGHDYGSPWAVPPWIPESTSGRALGGVTGGCGSVISTGGGLLVGG